MSDEPSYNEKFDLDMMLMKFGPEAEKLGDP
jgi:hypothetical protein